MPWLHDGGTEDLHQVVEAVDVGSEVGHEHGAVVGCVPLHELLPEPAGDTEGMLSPGNGAEPGKECACWVCTGCQHTLLAGPISLLCVCGHFCSVVLTCECRRGEYIADNYWFGVRLPECVRSADLEQFQGSLHMRAPG